MRGAAALIALSFPAAVCAAASPPSDLELYSATMLTGLHSHPVGRAGARIEAAERAVAHRRAAIRAWLVSRLGEEPLSQLERATHDEVESVYWSRGPTEEEEWARIVEARQSLGRLEQRRRRLERRH